MSKKLIAVSLFTGAGGMDVGFERPGIKVVFANEVMKEAAQTYILIDFRAFYGLDKFSLKKSTSMFGRSGRITSRRTTERKYFVFNR